MIHEKRRYHVGEISTTEELAEKLTQHTWTLCSGFLQGGMLFLNDSFSEDGAQEYAVFVKKENSGWVQVESITFSWCSKERALELIGEVKRGEYGCWTPHSELKIERAEGHRCGLCA